jgi:hypothetical protein
MLQAVYKTSPYTFYLSTEDKRIDTSKTNTNNLLYLFKLTNDMSGEIQYAFSPVYTIYNRYSKFQLYHNTTPTYWQGRVNLVPNGYWNYKVYEYSGDTVSGSTCPTIPNPTTNVIGYYTITDPSAAITTTNLIAGTDVYEHSLTDLDAGAYTIKLYDNCDTLIASGGFTIPSITAQSDGTRWVQVQNVDQTSTGLTFEVVSNMPIGHSYDFQQGSGSYTQVTDITSKPQTTSHSFTQIDPPTSVNNLVEMRAYDQTGGNAGGGATVFGLNTIDFTPIEQPSSYYGLGGDVSFMPVSVNGSGTVLSKGSAIITVIYGATANSTTQNYYTLQGLTTQGKLYVSEPSGEEQVQYNQHPEPSGNNYIWYGQ